MEGLRRLRTDGQRRGIEYRSHRHIRSNGSNKGTIYWDTDISGERSAVHSAPFTFDADGEWHEVTVPFQPAGTLSRIAVGTHKDDGKPQIDWIELLQE